MLIPMDRFVRFLLPLAIFAAVVTSASGQTSEAPRTNILSDGEWRRVDDAVDNGLRYLASQQAANGSIKTHRNGQPGVTALAVLAFLQHGHLPGQGPYGDTIDRALDYILSCQRRNGLLALKGPHGSLDYTPMPHRVGVAVCYNHAIAGMALSEAYGMTGGAESRLREPIEKALKATLVMQKRKKQRAHDEGGLRYFHFDQRGDADLSVIGWHLKFLRSGKNAGFEVPDEAISSAVEYVLRCYNPEFGTFEYEISPNDRQTRAMAGVGILALAHSSRHNRPEALAAADWLLQRYSFTDYNRQARCSNHSYNSDRYHYGVFYCTQAMYQMGGRHWEQFFPPVARTLVNNQSSNGSWDAESAHDGHFGRTYTTSLALLALGAPNQLLPIYQR